MLNALHILAWPPKKSHCFQALQSRVCYPQPPRALHLPWEEVPLPLPASLPLLQGNLVSWWPRQAARAAPAPPWGKQEGAQPGVPGRQSLSWQRSTAFKRWAGRQLQAVNRWLEGSVESGKGSIAQEQILLFCVLCMGCGCLEVPYM